MRSETALKFGAAVFFVHKIWPAIFYGPKRKVERKVPDMATFLFLCDEQDRKLSALLRPRLQLF